ncbi:MAG: hypothetical protein ACOX4A_03650 [Saccharofermentanales bacterium]|jgi:hypothetical protein
MSKSSNKTISKRNIALLLIAIWLPILIVLSSCSSSDLGETESAPQAPDETTTRVTLPELGSTTTYPEPAISEVTKTRTVLPDDFSFTLTWNVIGDSFYNSVTGKLVKTRHYEGSDEHTRANLILTDEEKLFIYRLLTEYIDIFSYPDEYDPMYPLMSKPSQTIVITMTANGKKKIVQCWNVALGEVEDANGTEGKDFMRVMGTIIDLLTSSEEWYSIPTEVLYQ